MIDIGGTEFSQEKKWDTGFSARVSRDNKTNKKVYRKEK